MQHVLQSMKMTMALRGFAKSTERTYLAHIQRFQAYCGKPIPDVGYDEVRAFLHHAITVRKVSPAHVNSAYGAIKFYYQSVLCREWNMLHVPRMKKKSSLPMILTPHEVQQLIDATANLKHRAILSTIYSAGLRVSEAAHLRISDIDSSNMRILVRQSKGNKDRLSILSEKNLLLLRHYWKSYRPNFWLFPGIPVTKPIATRTIQSVFKQSLLASGIAKDVSIHALRHSFATHSLNHGASILQIKELLGHSDIQTTSMYLHLTHAQVLGLKSPLDLITEGMIVLELQHVFARFARPYLESHPVHAEGIHAATAIVNCRTAVLGGHLDRCDSCEEVKISYNSCRNRHCPKCGNLKKEQWILDRTSELLPVPYFHTVFTVPHQLNALFLANPSVMYSILCRAASGTLAKLALDKKFLGAQIGVTMVLHTLHWLLSFLSI